MNRWNDSFQRILLCQLYLLAAREQNTNLPIGIPAVQFNDSTCPSVNYTAHKKFTRRVLQENYFNSHKELPCSCGGTGDWTRAIFLNMSDTSQNCPSSRWSHITTPVRGCGRTSSNGAVCDSVTFSVGRSYSNVCGRIVAVQKGQAGAFYHALNNNINTLDTAYLDGISLTHGTAGSRQHIWSFVGTYYEQDPSYRPDVNCACTNTGSSWPYQIPSFINNNYFCETGNPGPSISAFTYYSNDPLWDGQGCGCTSSCCQFNSPPWFCTILPQATSDDLEVRNCYADSSSYEDKIITLIDIYVK